MPKHKKQSPASAVIAASLEMAHEDAQRRIERPQSPQQPQANSFAERKKRRRNAKLAWAQNVIQTAYTKYGLQSDDFKWIWLCWYLIFLPAYRLLPFQEFSATVLSVWKLMDKLPAGKPDRLLDFHMQLAGYGPRGLEAKWQDRGTLIYHWLNRAFAREWDNLAAKQVNSSIQHESLVTEEDLKRTTEDDEANLAIDVERYHGDDVVAAEPWFEKDSHGAERVRQNQCALLDVHSGVQDRERN